MKEQQKRKIQQFHPEIEDGIDLRRCPQPPLLMMPSNSFAPWDVDRMHII